MATIFQMTFSMFQFSKMFSSWWALKSSLPNDCVEFQRYPLKFHTKYLNHILKDTIFTQYWNLKSLDLRAHWQFKMPPMPMMLSYLLYIVENWPCHDSAALYASHIICYHLCIWIMIGSLSGPAYGWCMYRQVSNIRRTKSQHLKDSHTVLRLSLPNPLKPDVKSRMKMWLEQRRQAMLQLHLNDRQFNCLLMCILY